MKRRLNKLVYALQIVALFWVGYTFVLHYELDDWAPILDEFRQLQDMKETFDAAKPQDSLTVLNGDQARVFNAMIELIELSHYVAFPSYKEGQYFYEFDSLVQDAFSKQSEINDTGITENYDAEKRYSNYIFIGIAAFFLFAILKKIISRFEVINTGQETEES